MSLVSLKRRLVAAAYLARRLLLGGGGQRFAPSGALAFDPAAPPEQGVVDGVLRGVLRGWARRLDRPQDVVQVDAYLDGDYLGRAECDEVRADLALTPGFGEGRHGFSFPLPERALRLGGALRVYGAGSGFELEGGPVELEGWRPASEGLRRELAAVDDPHTPFGGAVDLAEIRRAYGPRLAVLTERDPAAGDAGLPVSRVMAYVNARYYGGALPWHGAQACCDLLMLAAEHFASAVAGLPLSAEQVAALVRPTGWLVRERLRSTVILDHAFAAARHVPPLDEASAASALAAFAYDVLARRRLPLELMSEAALRFLQEEVGGRHRTRFGQAFAGLPLFRDLTAQSDAAAAVVGETAVRLGLGRLAGRPGPEETSEPPVRLAPGVRIVQGDHGESGLSVNVRQSARALAAAGIDAQVSRAPLLRAGRRGAFEHLGDPAYETVLLHVPPDDAVEVILRLPPAQARARLIGFFVWETERLPAAHQLGALLVDEIWTASTYCAAAFRAAAPETPVVVVGHAVGDGDEAPGSDAGTRARDATARDATSRDATSWDARAWARVAPDDFLFLFHFDAHSWITRKNPVAAVRAFRDAFASGERDVRLLIKVRRGEDAHEPQWRAWWAELYEEAAEDDRIQIANETLDGARMAALTGACDAFVSLHRSEGFGYGIAEAMLAAKPVIVTDYSGSIDFISAAEAMLVPAHRRPVRTGEFLYGDPTQIWGEPDVAAAAAAMRTLYEDRELGRRLGERGRERMLAQGSIERLAERYAERLRPATP